METNQPPFFVKFTGEFKALKSLGWRFWKAYARNYKVYQFNTDGGNYGQVIYIWQHHGGYVEIDDLGMYSSLFIQDLLQDKPESRHGCYAWYLDRDETKLIHKDYTCQNNPDSELKRAKDFVGEDWDEYYRRYREIRLTVATVDKILELLDQNMITLRPRSEFK